MGAVGTLVVPVAPEEGPVRALPDFEWQTGYGAFSVGSSEIDRVVGYISNQEQHHADGTIWPDLDLED